MIGSQENSGILSNFVWSHNVTYLFSGKLQACASGAHQHGMMGAQKNGEQFPNLLGNVLVR